MWSNSSLLVLQFHVEWGTHCRWLFQLFLPHAESRCSSQTKPLERVQLNPVSSVSDWKFQSLFQQNIVLSWKNSAFMRPLPAKMSSVADRNDSLTFRSVLWSRSWNQIATYQYTSEINTLTPSVQQMINIQGCLAWLHIFFKLKFLQSTLTSSLVFISLHTSFTSNIPFFATSPNTPSWHLSSRVMVWKTPTTDKPVCPNLSWCLPSLQSAGRL